LLLVTAIQNALNNSDYLIHSLLSLIVANPLIVCPGSVPVMAIEIKQLLIKSTVVDDEYHDGNNNQQLVPDNIKHEVLEECRRLIQEMLSDKGQR
jgi:hypothetical protein